MKGEINQIQLTPVTLAAWYPDQLVELHTPQTAGVAAAPKAVTEKARLWSGENRKNILVISSPEPGMRTLEFLTGILGACKLSQEDIALISEEKMQLTGYKNLVAEVKPGIVLLFGTTPAALDLPVLFPEFQIQALTGIRYLSAPALALMTDDKQLKTKLWTSLRTLFGI